MENETEDRVVPTAIGAAELANETPAEGADVLRRSGSGTLAAAASRHRGELDRLANLLSLLRTPQSPAAIQYGRVRYEGILYVVAKEVRPEADLDELCRLIADHGGRSRYGTLGRPTWYGALDPSTAVAEACYHALKDPGNWGTDQTLGAMYQLRVRGRFIDLHGRELAQPQIVGDDYTPTQALARHVRGTPLSGVLYPSARSSGTCLAVFSRQALHSAKFVDTIPMRRINANTIKVRPPWNAQWWTLRRESLRRVPVSRAEYA